MLVPHRENAIVNRLNKTKVEKKPDLKAERDDMLKELRKKEQAAQLIKVRSEHQHLSLAVGKLDGLLRSLGLRTHCSSHFQFLVIPCIPALICFSWVTDLCACTRKKKNRDRRKSGRKRSGKRTMHTTTSSPTRTWLPQATRTERRTGKTTLCRCIKTNGHCCIEITSKLHTTALP